MGIRYVYGIISLYPSSALQKAIIVFLKVQLQAMFLESFIIFAWDFSHTKSAPAIFIYFFICQFVYESEVFVA